MTNQIGCPICESPQCVHLEHVGDSTLFECQVCGPYRIARSALAGKLDPQNHDLTVMQRAVLSYKIREVNDAGREPPLLTTYVLDDVIATGRLPSPGQQAINIVRFIGDRVTSSGKPVRELPPSFHASVGSPNRDFSLRIAKQLVEAGHLSAFDAGHLDSPHEMVDLELTLTGWAKYEQEKRGQAAAGYGFIALKFNDPVLDPFVRDVVKPAVEALGFDLVDMRDAAEAGIIDNVMRARIRDAAFVLVDLTHANAGAYWEAGYAEGLGKPVLYLCNSEIFENRGTHFDTNHCTTVLWDPAQAEPFTKELVATLRRSLGLFAS